MLATIATRLTDQLYFRCPLDPSRKAIYEYGIQLSLSTLASMCSAPLPELMDRKKRNIMERKGDKEDENKRQKQQKESSAAAL